MENSSQGFDMISNFHTSSSFFNENEHPDVCAAYRECAVHRGISLSTLEGD